MQHRCAEAIGGELYLDISPTAKWKIKVCRSLGTVPTWCVIPCVRLAAGAEIIHTVKGDDILRRPDLELDLLIRAERVVFPGQVHGIGAGDSLELGIRTKPDVARSLSAQEVERWIDPDVLHYLIGRA